MRRRANLIECGACCSLRAACLPHEDFARHATTFLALVGRSGADIVVRDDRRHFDTVLGGKLDRHLHVHVVTGIVAVENDNALAAVGLADGVVEALGGWRGEQFTNRDGIEHVFAGIADERRFVPRAAARNDADLACNRRACSGNHARVFGKPNDVGMSFDKTLDRVLNDFVRIVDEALHGISCKMNER